MSENLVPIRFPLSGSRLIEASAGTGKTWTIAALYVRLVLGHGGEQAFVRPLLPAEILVMTFTKAATRELCERVRERLLTAARSFRDCTQAAGDPFLRALLEAYPGEAERAQAAHRLAMAAEAMDDAAVMTIDAWCQRMLREHAFDSGSLFDETLVASEAVLLREAVRDYWRTHVYSMDSAWLPTLLDQWPDLGELESAIGPAVGRAHLFAPAPPGPLTSLMGPAELAQAAAARALKAGWGDRVARMRAWYEAHRARFDGKGLPAATVGKVLNALQDWATDEDAVCPGDGYHLVDRLFPEFMLSKAKDKAVVLPDDFARLPVLQRSLATLETMQCFLIRHAAVAIAARVAELKARRRQFGFADLLSRLRQALEGANAVALRARIIAQFPVAMIDEFQDTSPDQYRIFDLLYRVATCDPSTALLMIGDPKQAIYGFRGADIHSYLAARSATTGRHYRLGTNYRSTHGVVGAINHLFLHAEGNGPGAGHERGAFGFRGAQGDPLPFEPVEAQGRQERFVGLGGLAQAPMTIWCNTEPLSAPAHLAHFAAQCAQTIATLLGCDAAGFASADGFTRLQPADIAVLVRNWREAEAVQAALRQRKVASVYLSDADSLFNSTEATDVLHWLRAIASPLDGVLARTAMATRTVGLSMDALAKLASDDGAWDAQVERLKTLRLVWQRQGVLAMLRRFIHELAIPAALLRETGGERALTNLLHLAELCQAAQHRLDGEQALIRWLAEQIEDDGQADDERILRLESDAQLVKVVTVHKAKGLEYPLVFLPFATSLRKVRGSRLFVELTDSDGNRYLDLSKDKWSIAAADAGRLEEDLRILYVALTRSRHALWAGVTSAKDKLHECAFGYLLSGGAPVANAMLAERLAAMCAGSEHLCIEPTCDPVAVTHVARNGVGATLCERPMYTAAFERDWAIGSYSAIVRTLGRAPVGAAVARPLAAAGRDDEDDVPNTAPDHGDAWHRFPRGSLPGKFLHDQLEWMATDGFAHAGGEPFATALGIRCHRAGWGHREADTVAWMRAIAAVTLPPLGRSLPLLGRSVPEMEFWLPAAGIDVAALDRHCCTHLLGAAARPRLQAMHLHGMLHGFMDLVCECDGRYWIIDYKSTALGTDDAAYHEDALAASVASHRYDVQAAIYVHALGRLLQVRLGSDYDPQRHLGGVVFWFLRGIGNPGTRGCFHMPPEPALLGALGSTRCVTEAGELA